MPIDILASGNAPCWIYSNKNVSGQSSKKILNDVTQKYGTLIATSS